MSAPRVVELSAGDRDVLIDARGTVAGYDMVAQAEPWVLEAQLQSAQLSRPLRQALLRFRRFGDPAGGLLVRGVPSGPASPTPSDVRASDPAATKAAAAMSVVLAVLGEQYGFRPEHGGRLVQNILPVRGYETEQISIASAVDLECHVEMAFSDLRSDFVGLLCLREDHEQGAGTTISSIDAVLPLVDARVVDVLREPRFRTRVDASFRLDVRHTGDVWADPISVLSGPALRPHVRVDFAETEGKDPDARAALVRLRKAVERARSTVLLRAGDLLIIDNHRALHGRTPFAAHYDGTDRWLLRSFVTKDLRRSEADRPADSRIVNAGYADMGDGAGAGGS